MNFHRSLSDQLYTWSAAHAKQTDFQPATPPHKPAATTPPFGRYSPWLSDRALQTLWKTRLQVRQRPWSRPQILPINQSNRQTPPDGLRTSGLCRAGQAVSGKSSACPDYFGRDLRDQSRTPAPPGAALTGTAGERNNPYTHRFLRYPSGCNLDRQYARVALRWRHPLICHFGGNS